jgi:hypothetical protein
MGNPRINGVLNRDPMSVNIGAQAVKSTDTVLCDLDRGTPET